MDIELQLNSFKSQLTDVQTNFRLLEKTIIKEFKNNVTNLAKNEKESKVQAQKESKVQAQKESKVQAQKESKVQREKEPSGFDTISIISDELAIFMNKPIGSAVARTEATQYIINYIRENKLQDPTILKKINPNDRLSNLFNLKEELTYFNLQKYLNIHFCKK